MGEILTNTTDKKIYYVNKKFFKNSKNPTILKQHQFKILGHFHRINILFMIMNAGSGHIGTSFSIIDFLIIFNKSKYKKFLLFSSKGHDSPAFYSIAISEQKIHFNKLFQFRKLEGLPGHPDRSINIFKFNTGSLGMGISKAKGYLKNKKNKFAFVIVGDGELQEGQIWESLNQKIPEGLKIIVDNNRLQSDFTTKSTSNIGNIKKKFEAFGLKVKEIDGHDYNEINNALKNINSFDCLILNTIKGNGVSSFHGNKIIYNKINYPFHSGAPIYEVYEKAIIEINNKIKLLLPKKNNFYLSSYSKKNNSISNENKVSMINIYKKFLIQKFKTNQKLICLDADLLIDHGLIDIKKLYPFRFIECGIAEMDMVSQASGISENKNIPICHSFSCFMSFRALEQIYNNCSERRKIIYTASLVGIVPSGPGHSHQAVKDFSNYGTIPNLIVCEPINSTTLEKCYRYFDSKKNESMFLRLNPLPVVSFNNKFSIKNIHNTFILKNWDLTKNKKKILIVTYGTTLSEQVLNAANKISKFNVKAISLIFLNRFNLKYYISEINKSNHVVFYDNQISGLTPFTLLVNELNTKYNYYFKYKLFAINDFPKCGYNNEVLDLYKFSTEKIYKYLMSL